MDTQPTRYEQAEEIGYRGYYASLPNAELVAAREPELYDLAEAQTYDAVTREVVERRCGTRLRVIDEQLARRDRLHRTQTGIDAPDPYDPKNLAWVAYNRDVRDQTDIVALLNLVGCQLVRVGRGKWGSGFCPACGQGDDRFVVWDGSAGGPPRFWCHRCDHKGDAITVYREFLAPGSGYFETLRFLGNLAGLPMSPDFGSTAEPVIDLGEIGEWVDLGELCHAS